MDKPRAGGPVRWALGIAMLLCVPALYAPTLSSTFVNWDDDVLVVQNPAVTSADGLARIWSTVEMPEGFPNYPLVFTSYWLEHRLWGLEPAAYHATNIALHALNSVLVLLLVEALGVSTWIALLTAILFAVHPMQVESVAWVAERKNVLATCFALLTCLAYLRYRATGAARWYALALLAFAAALLSKTAVVVVPLSLALIDMVCLRRRGGEVVPALLPMVVLAAAGGLWTVAVERHPPSMPLLERLLLAASSLWFYAGQLLAPISLMPVYPRADVSLARFQCWLPLVSLVAGLVLIWRFAKRPQVRWGLGHFLCMLLPTLGLVSYGFNEMSYVADRHVYLAAVGFFLALVLMVAHVLQRVRIGLAVTLAAVVVLGLAVRTRQQIAVWHDAETLWTATINANPAAWVAYNNLAMVYIDQERLNEARRLLETALVLNPEYPQAHNNLALVLYRHGTFDAAADHCRQAVALRPGDATFRKNLGLSLAAAGDVDGATTAFRHVVRIEPSATSHAYLANLLVTRGRLPEAAAHFERALSLDPSLVDARNQLGRTLLALDRLPEAASAFGEVVRSRPGWPEGRYNLSLVLRRLGQRQAAAHELEVALALHPDFTAAREALAALQRGN